MVLPNAVGCVEIFVNIQPKVSLSDCIAFSDEHKLLRLEEFFPERNFISFDTRVQQFYLDTLCLPITFGRQIQFARKESMLLGVLGASKVFIYQSSLLEFFQSESYRPHGTAQREFTFIAHMHHRGY